MTFESLKEGDRLQSLIKDYRRTLEYIERIDEKDKLNALSDFFISTRNVPNKSQMAQVAINAIIDSCNTCIDTAQKLFDEL